MNGLLFFYLMFVLPIFVVLKIAGILQLPWWVILAPILVPLAAVANIAFVLVLLNFA